MNWHKSRSPTCPAAVATGCDGSVRYEIRVEGILGQGWSGWFDGLQITSEPGDVTVIAGQVADQAALHGLLARARDLNLPLISLRRIEPP